MKRGDRARAGLQAGLVRLASRVPDDPALIERGLAAAAQPAGPRARLNCIVFSKDRALQLDACLRSIRRFAPYEGSITVIYHASTDAFAAGYRLLDPGPSVELRPEDGDFRATLLAAVDEDPPLTVFHTDDDLFYRQPPTAPSVPDGFVAFSLRLGENTTHAYIADRSQPLPARASARGPLMAWNWTRATDDFAYPLSLNGHVLRTEFALSLLSSLRFESPSLLEGRMHSRRMRLPRLMLAFRESSVVSVPVNVVDTSTRPHRSGGNPGLSAAALNEQLLEGYRIDLDAIDSAAVHSAHQELELPLRRAQPGE